MPNEMCLDVAHCTILLFSFGRLTELSPLCTALVPFFTAKNHLLGKVCDACGKACGLQFEVEAINNDLVAVVQLQLLYRSPAAQISNQRRIKISQSRETRYY